MPRKKATPPAAAPAPDNSGFDVPPAPQTPPPSSTVDPPSSPPSATPHDSPITDHALPEAKPSPVNATSIVIVPKQSFLRMQKLQTAKARQEQLRILARKHPVVRDLIKQLNKP